MAQMYSFDPSKGETHESLRRRREALEQVANAWNQRPPRTLGQGISALGDGFFGGLEARDVKRREEANRQMVADAMMQAQNGGITDQMALEIAPYATPEQQLVFNAMMGRQEAARNRELDDQRWVSRFEKQNEAQNARFDKQLAANMRIAGMRAAGGSDTSVLHSVLNTPDGAYGVRRDGSLFPLQDAEGNQLITYQADPNLAGEKKLATEKAVNLAEAQKNLPKVEGQASIANTTIDRLLNHPAKGYSTGLLSNLPTQWLPSRAEFEALRKQTEGQGFLQAFESLRGGGHITEIEGVKATQAIVRMQTAVSEEAFDQALRDYQEIINMGVERARQAAGVTPPQPSVAPPAGDGWSITPVK